MRSHIKFTSRALEVNLKLTGVGNIPVEAFAFRQNMKAGTDLDKENILRYPACPFYILQRQEMESAGYFLFPFF